MKWIIIGSLITLAGQQFRNARCSEAAMDGWFLLAVGVAVAIIF